MKRSDALTCLREATKALRTLGVRHLYVFGSTARDTATGTSDVDIFVDRDPDKPLDLLGLAKIESYLESVLGTQVDVTTRGGLHPILRPDIEQQAIQVF